MTASLFRLVLWGRRRLGKPCSLSAAGREVGIKWFRRSCWSPVWFFGLDLAEFALAAAFPVEILLSLPLPFSIKIPVPPDCLGPGGRLSLKGTVRRLFQARSRRVQRGRFRASVRRLGCGVLLIPQSLPEAAGHFGAIAAPTNGPVRRSRSRSGRSRSRGRSSARGGAGSEGGNASLGGSGLDRRRSSRSRPRRGSRGLDPDVGPGPGLPVGSISSPCG